MSLNMGNHTALAGAWFEGAWAKPGCSEAVYETLHQIATSLGHAIDAKDPSTSSHSKEVADLARCLAQRIGCSQRQADVIHIAGHLHDIGKIGIPDAVLAKPGRLTEAEWELIRAHPVVSARIIAPVQAMNGSTGIAEMVLHHHERWDGKGYPHGLKGDHIPVGARILCLADSLSAMLQNRPYRNRLSLGQAVQEMRCQAGKQFDPVLCPIIVEMLEETGGLDEYCGTNLLVTRIAYGRVTRRANKGFAVLGEPQY